MPKFFFHLREGGKLRRDTEGLELPGKRQAVDEAKAAAYDMIMDRVISRKWIEDDTLEIADEAGNPVCTIPVRSILAGSQK